VLWGDFSSYLEALWGYARWLLAGGPFFIDTVLKRVSPKLSAYLDRLATPRSRQNIEVSIIAIAIFLASFLAWRDEHRALIDSEKARTQALSDLSEAKKKLSISEATKEGQIFIKSNLERLYLHGGGKLISQYAAESQGKCCVPPDRVVIIKSEADAYILEVLSWVQTNLGEVAESKISDTNNRQFL
jgi:hypothetical protein